MDFPQSVSLVQEEIVSVSHCKKIRQESQSQILSEQPVSFEHTELAEERKDNPLFGQLIDRSAGLWTGYMLTPLKMRALRLLFAIFYW